MSLTWDDIAAMPATWGGIDADGNVLPTAEAAAATTHLVTALRAMGCTPPEFVASDLFGGFQLDWMIPDLGYFAIGVGPEGQLECDWPSRVPDRPPSVATLHAAQERLGEAIAATAEESTAGTLRSILGDLERLGRELDEE